MLKVTLRGQFNARPLEIKGRVGDILGVRSSKQPWKMDLACRLAETTVGLKGSVRDMAGLRGLDAAVDIKGQSLQGLVCFFDNAPFPPLGKFGLRFRVTNPAPGLFRVDDLQATGEGMALSGKGEVKLGGKRPGLALDLTAPTLDTRPVMAALSTPHAPGEVSKRKAGTSQIKKDKVFSQTPFALGHLRAADIRFDLKTGTFITPGLAAENLHIGGELSNGRLTVHSFKAVAGKAGTLDGQIDLRTKGRQLALTARFKVDQADLKTICKTMGKKSPATGLLDLRLDLAGDGRSVAELMAGLDGMIEVTMGKGRLNATNIDFLGGDLTNGIRDALNPLKKKRDHTPVNCFVGRCDIRNGLATLSALVLSTPETTLLGEGIIDLGTEKLHVGMQTVPSKGFSPVTLCLGNLARPFELGGTLAHPRLELDAMKSTATMGKALGGIAVFGPFGILAALASTDSDDGNPCVRALERARAQAEGAGEKAQERGVVKKAVGMVGCAAKGVGNALKGLFGKEMN